MKILILILGILFTGCTTNLEPVEEVEPNSIKAIIISFIVLSIAGFVIYGQYKELESRDKYKKIIDELKTFSYFVGNCNIAIENKNAIIAHLKDYRARDEMEYKEYSDIIWQIDQLYIKRFLM